jgi:hypothetical protein
VSSLVCFDCRRPVVWAVTVNGKRLALNPDPDADGNQAAYREGTPAGAWHTRQLGKDQEPLAYERRYMPHVATCPRRQQPAKPAPLPPNVIPITRARSRRG